LGIKILTPPLHSFLELKMSAGFPESTPAQAARLVAVAAAVTTSYSVLQFCVSRTAESKTETLKKFLNDTIDKHQDLDNNLLPKIPPELRTVDENTMQIMTFMLSSLKSRLNVLEEKVAAAGIWRWSPVYLHGEIMIIYGELTKLHQNTVSTSAATNRIIAQSPSDENGVPQWFRGNCSASAPELKPAQPADASAGRV